MSDTYVSPCFPERVHKGGEPAISLLRKKTLNKTFPVDAKVRLPMTPTISAIADSIWESDLYASGMDGESYTRATADELHDMLRALNPSTIDAMYSNMPAEDESTFIADLLFDVEASERTIREVLALRSVFDEYLEAELVESVVSGLRNYDMFKDEQDLSLLSGSRLSLARSLCIVADTLAVAITPNKNAPLSSWNSPPGRHITDDELVRCLIDYPDRGQFVSDLLMNRRACDAQLIRHCLEDGTVLVVGAL